MKTSMDTSSMITLVNRQYRSDTICIPSGKRKYLIMANHLLYCETPYQWPASIAMLVFRQAPQNDLDLESTVKPGDGQEGDSLRTWEDDGGCALERFDC